MRITLTITDSERESEEQDLLSLEITPDITVEALRNIIETETTFHPSAQHLYHNGRLITDNEKTVEQLGIADGDMLALHIRDMRGSSVPQRPPVGADGTAQPGSGPAVPQDPETIRLQILGTPHLRNELAHGQPALAAVVEDPQRWAQQWDLSYNKEQREREARYRQIQALNADPFDPQAQARIAEIIRQERVMENLQSAMEHNPEVFGLVHMLYVDVEVNGYKVKALVDSGAQATIMSPTCAEACGIMRLVDKRFAGVARGVGTATIIGRVHSAQIRIGSLFLACSFTVMEGKNVELLLGLDMLKRYQASIDLAKDKLIIQGVEIPFLGEAEIPKESEEAFQAEPRMPGPAGTSIGQRSGAVIPPGGRPAAAAFPGAGHQQQQQGAVQPGRGVPPPPIGPPIGVGRPPHQNVPPPGFPGGAAIPQGPIAQPTPAAQFAPQRRQFPREHIDQLKALGASEALAIQALEQSGGNVEVAASIIVFNDGF